MISKKISIHTRDINELKRRDYELIKERFYQSLDVSYALTLLSAKENSFRGVALIGEGYHFKSLRLPVRTTNALSLVLSIAKETFLKSSPEGVKKWVLAMKTMSNMNFPLVPPLEVVQNGDALGYLTPFCDRSLRGIHPYYAPLEDEIRGLKHGLQTSSMILDDLMQIGAVEGVPFVYDWSDLIFVDEKSTR